MRNINFLSGSGFKVLIFVIAVACVSCSSVDRERYKEIYEAAKAVDGAIENKKTYSEFTTLFQKFSAEISAAKDSVKSDGEKKLLNAYSELFETYQDGFLLWEYRVRSSIYGWIPEGRIYLEPGIKYIAEKYNLQKQSHVLEFTNHHWESVSADSIQVIWEKARKQFRKVRCTNLRYFICP